MIGACLTTMPLIPLPASCSHENAATLGSEQLPNCPAIFAAFYIHGVMQTSRKQRSSALGLYDLNACLLRRPALRSSIFQLRKGLQSCTCGQPLHCHLRIH